MQDATIPVSPLPLLYVGYPSSAVLYVILSIHIIGPTDQLHPSPTKRKIILTYFLFTFRSSHC